MSNAGCIVSRFNHHLALTVAQQVSIRRLEEVEKTRIAGDIIRHGGNEVRELFVIEHGWMALSSHADFPDRDRRIDTSWFPAPGASR